MTELRLIGRPDDNPEPRPTSKPIETLRLIGAPGDDFEDTQPISETEPLLKKVERSGRCLYEQRQVSSAATLCAFCGRTARRYEAHHAVPLSEGEPQTEEEGAVLTALCPECHTIAHAIRKATSE